MKPCPQCGHIPMPPGREFIVYPRRPREVTPNQEAQGAARLQDVRQPDPSHQRPRALTPVRS